MPLRDHFGPPLDERASWEGFHGGWPMVIVQRLRTILPPGYVAAPKVCAGTQVDFDVETFERDRPLKSSVGEDPGGVATAVWSPPEPSVAVETTLPDFDEYEVRVLDARRGRRLVAAIEIVSPANKDRPEHRNVFVAKCAGLLQSGVAVSIVDLVTVRQFNLYSELMTFIGHDDATFCEPPPTLYAASCRWITNGNRKILQTWSHQLTLGQPLPTLPLWLTRDLVVPLDLEKSYEKACYDLWLA